MDGHSVYVHAGTCPDTLENNFPKRVRFFGIYLRQKETRLQQFFKIVGNAHDFGFAVAALRSSPEDPVPSAAIVKVRNATPPLLPLQFHLRQTKVRCTGDRRWEFSAAGGG